MKEFVLHVLKKTGLSHEELERLVEVPKERGRGDYAFPCFSLAQSHKKNPVVIAKEFAHSLVLPKEIERVEAVGPYLNFFMNGSYLAEKTLSRIMKEKKRYGSSTLGKGKTIAIDMSSPNIAKPFGIGHLRSTIIGNSIALLHAFQGYKTVRINYLGDWGTPFGKIIAGFKEFGDSRLLKQKPIQHLYDIYVKASKDERFEKLGREWFKKMEKGDKEALRLWKQFRTLSIKEFNDIYKLLGVRFDVISGESEYNSKMDATVKELEKKKLLVESDGAWIVNLESYGLGVCLIKKSDGATLYATRDITAAIDRQKKYKADRLLYEVGSEQKLHFKQFFKVLELMGYSWARECVHIDHGLYLDSDGKKFATRKGKTVFMEDILHETIELARKEIRKRDDVPEKEVEKRALAIARAAIFYGDLKNYRGHDMLFDIDRFVSFEGDTGPYLLYSYARAESIVRKAGKKKKSSQASSLEEQERRLLNELARFPDVVSQAAQQYAPSLIAQYAYLLAQTFNEFYHTSTVIGSDNEAFRIKLVQAFAQTLKNALTLLGITPLEEM